MKELSIEKMEMVSGGDKFTCGLAIASTAFGVGMFIAYPPAAAGAFLFGYLGTGIFGIAAIATSCSDHPFQK